MKKLSIELPKYRLQFHYRLVRRRKPLVPEPLIPTVRRVNKKYRSGSLVGKFVRYVSEHKSARKFFAANFAIVAITTSLIPQTENVLAQTDINNQSVIQPGISLVTEKGIQTPVEKKRITQGYSFFHPGIDMDGVTGDPIKSIKPGKVESVSYSKYAYGNSIIVNHGNGLTSLYAHLSKIEVSAGQEVTMNTEIGKMGATGRAFGDHLHLEVYDHGKQINPLTVLP